MLGQDNPALTSEAAAINANGDIVGSCDGVLFGPYTYKRAVLWSGDDQVEDLNALIPARSSRPRSPGSCGNCNPTTSAARSHKCTSCKETPPPRRRNWSPR
jgi:hypothetical protein